MMQGIKQGIGLGREKGRKEGHKKGRTEGRKEGISIGIKQGIEQRNRDLARKCLQKGISISEIAELTGLTEEQINSIRNYGLHSKVQPVIS